MFKLQNVQNTAAQLVSRKRKRDSISSTLTKLHWLNVESRIMFKMILIVYKVVKVVCSNNLMVSYKLYNCRPNDYLMLETRSVKTKYGRRTFEYAGPRLWNALPLELRMMDSIETFKKQLKTLLFKDAIGLKQRAFKYN